MGWTGTHKRKGQSYLEFFREEFHGDTKTNAFELIDGAVKNFVFYGVERVRNLATDTAEFRAVIILISRNPGDYNIHYKDMTESSGPYAADVPEKIWKLILTLIPEPPNEYAAQWRERVRAFKAKPKLRKGMTVKFKEPIKFTDGSSHDTFYVEARGAFKRLDANYATYRISHAQDRDFEVLTTEQKV